MHGVCRDLERLPIPVVAFVDGAAIGGGAELAAFADIRIGTPEATFEWKQISMGLSTGYGAAKKLSELVGQAIAQKWLYFAQTVTSLEAMERGLLHKIVNDYQDFLRVLDPILNSEPRALAHQKKLLRMATIHPTGDQTSVDTLFRDLWRNPTHEAKLKEFLARKSSL
jgi:enoyl-CoA hydratase/carnithine racemase